MPKACPYELIDSISLFKAQFRLLPVLCLSSNLGKNGEFHKPGCPMGIKKAICHKWHIARILFVGVGATLPL